MTIPLSGTDVRLFSGIPFSPDQMNVRWFTSLANQNTYFNSQTVVKTITDNVTIKVTDEIGIFEIKVGETIDSLLNVNYLSFKNNTKQYYAFVVYKKYINKETTAIYLKLDVMQTYMFDINIKPSYVIREHHNIDSNLLNNLLDEGIDYGDEYELISATEHKISSGVKWLVVASKQAIHFEWDGTSYIPAPKEVTAAYIGSPQPLSYYILPYVDNESTMRVEIDSELFPMSSANDFLTALYKSESATNNIVSIYVTSFIGLSYVVNIDDTIDAVTFDTNYATVKAVAVGQSPNYGFCVYVENVPEFTTRTITAGTIESGFSSVSEEKLKCFPYRKIVLTDLRGNMMEYKPQYLTGTNLEINIKGSIGTSNKIAVGLMNYNISTSISENIDRKLTYLNSFINADPQDIPVVVDMLSAYMQGNRNSIENQKNQTIFNGVMNLTLQGMSTARGTATLNPINGVTNLGSGINSMIQTYGNMQLQLESFNAKQKDIANMPPALASQGSNIMFSEGNKMDSIWVLKYQIKQEYIDRLSAYFKTYGYKTNLVKQPIIKNRSSWNYLQLGFANITGNISGEALTEIKRIFMNGVFLWHVNDVGNLSLSNTYTP